METVSHGLKGHGMGKMGEMHMESYTTAEFAQKLNITARTGRFYDEKGIIKPSSYDESGNRRYSEKDVFLMQKILSLKFMGFSLKEIKELVRNRDNSDLGSIFDLQIDLVRQKINSLKQMEAALLDAKEIVASSGKLEWTEIINLIYLSNMDARIYEQYKNAKNLSVRIRLHQKYSNAGVSWFQWIGDHLELDDSRDILEIGCGSGELWKGCDAESLRGKRIVLSDISPGMLQEAQKSLPEAFRFLCFDCQAIPFEDQSFDRLIANHVLFYAKNMNKALGEISRVLRDGGMLCCSTYGNRHMKEVSDIVKEFDPHIHLSDIELYHIFGLDNGEGILKKYFKEVTLCRYDDSLTIDDPMMLCDYIYSCHGNQNDFLYEKKEQFESYIKKLIQKNGAIHVTKEAGIFICRKPIRSREVQK